MIDTKWKPKVTIVFDNFDNRRVPICTPNTPPHPNIKPVSQSTLSFKAWPILEEIEVIKITPKLF